MIYGRVTLAGGDPEAMNLKQFLDAAYVILVDEYQRIGIDLLSAIEKVAQWTAGASEDSPPPSHQNEQAMTLLKGRLSGVSGAPI